MANDYNHCVFTGRLGKSPEIRYMPDGKAVTTFSIACNESYKKKDGEKVEKCQWIRIVTFGKLAEICGEYISQGSKVLIAGKFQTREWEKDGTKQYTTEIVAREMQMLGSKGDKPESSATEEPPQVNPDDDDVPF